LPSTAHVVSPSAETWDTPVRPRTGAAVPRVAVLPSPSWPASLLPQHTSPPSVSRAQLCSSPVTITAAVVTPTTRTGWRLSLIEPSPSWPALLRPQHDAAPSAIAQLWLLPATIASIPDSPMTWFGLSRSTAVLSPSWPNSLRPQHHAVPSVRTAQLCSLPADAAIAHSAGGSSVGGTSGTQRSAMHVWPSAHSPSGPQAKTAPV
jgi:hypothetical protein